MSLPYPLPEHWQLHDTQLRRRWPVVIWVLVATALAVAMVAANLSGSIDRGILLAASFGAVTAALGVSYQRAGAERGLPLLMNAVVLSRATERPPDSWIHFFSETGASRWLAVCFSAAGLISSASLVWTAVHVVREGGAALWWWLLLVPLLIAALILSLAGVIAIVQFVRHATFGHRHIGLSLGRHGVVRYYLDEVDVWPWEKIARIEASGKALDKETGDFSAKLVLVPHGDQPAGVTLSEYIVDGYQSHAWLIYTAARFWAEHPQLRSELGTTYAQRRIEGWRDAMITPPSTSAVPMI